MDECEHRVATLFRDCVASSFILRVVVCSSDNDIVKSGQALVGGPCPTGQLGDGVTCKVNPCFLKNGGRGLHSSTIQLN